ncbi:Uu.00g028540.m01.CDS01 [Anthostomella pinea]|uniref:Uu.00g028540.m01.CDS01 n=1 Tax=Anthostomella pinea TaxID=933095 RepID=A0AAI8V7Y7_9PEZI|nr:Uu.00g028540.m01.CDS01 [Anthostomella pinea]
MIYQSGSRAVRVPYLLAILVFSTLASAQFPWASTIPRTGWTVTADSYQAGNEPAKALDGNSSTFWHTQYSPSDAPLPHYIQVDMQKSYVVSGFSYRPRQDGNSNGNIGQHTVTLSNDGTTWSDPVQFGLYLNDSTDKTTFFSNASARYVRLTAQTEAQGTGNAWSSVVELNVYSPDPTLSATQFTSPPTSQGCWDTTVVLPIVPAAGAISETGNVVFWSAFRPDLFTSGTGQTFTSSWTPGLQAVTERTVTNTQHDMFCPGISLDADGRITVTGGNDNKKTSIYDPATAGWAAAAQMNLPRGYQSQATLSDGRIFTIGGSWSGDGVKNGEIYTPGTNTWKALAGCAVVPMLTNDAQGVYRGDNHAWLFAYKGNSVFQAGPSRNMNWYNVSGGTSGSYTSAGTRAADSDAMCGNAVMYDAVAGLILAAGGSPSYQDSDATSNTHVIKLGTANAAPTVTKLPSMAYARAFANGVVLPDGKVLIVGGQSYPIPFTDTTPAFPAELFDPATGTWAVMASIAVPRTYHSIALLLPDATVLNGGGGLCGTGCVQNHFDVQIFSPPYLFNGDGTRAARPAIEAVSAAQMAPGAAFTVTTDSLVDGFALVRYGSATHTVNTDQRRVPLSATGVSGLTYTLQLPADPGVLVPGYWMLFALNAGGVPSVAATVKILVP